MSVQSRIRALEAAASTTSSSSVAPTRPSPHPISSPRTSLTFSSDDALTSVSSSPTAVSLLDDMDSFVIMAGGPMGSSPSSPPALSATFAPRQSVAAKPVIPPKSPGLQSTSNLSTSPRPLINFSSPPRAKESSSANGLGIGTTIPPLPPRKQPSVQSLDLQSGGVPPLPPRQHKIPSPPPTPGMFKRSDSLTIDQIPNIGGTSNSKGRHNHASSTSSFISLSLSSDPGDADRISDDTVTISSPATSLSEDHSSTSKPISIHDWNQKTPTLTQKPFKSPTPYISKHVVVPSPPPRLSSPAPSLTGSYHSQSSHTSAQTHRRPAPPPPLSRPANLGSLSAHSSFSSNASSSASSATSLTKRKTPVPPAARLRYEALFDRNMASRSASSSSENVTSPTGRSRGRATGWRGLSIDLMTAGPSVPDGMENQLDGASVKAIWSCSKLDRAFLKELWLECDRDKKGFLDKESFIQGMWRIDEELSKRASAKRPLPRQTPVIPPRLPYTPRR
ncbi:hypothetical protein FRC03_008134 [Tulasnella sp. 419]|nr:hypothetical protein FRC02_004980 [Tulasnella sp. 418]KAG8968268.1 hypothetical protein FRC03_008134 [Tulasnella sp. 419]